MLLHRLPSSLLRPRGGRGRLRAAWDAGISTASSPSQVRAPRRPLPPAAPPPCAPGAWRSGRPPAAPHGPAPRRPPAAQGRRAQLDWQQLFTAAKLAQWSGLCYLGEAELQQALQGHTISLVAQGRSRFTSWCAAAAGGDGRQPPPLPLPARLCSSGRVGRPRPPAARGAPRRRRACTRCLALPTPPAAPAGMWRTGRWTTRSCWTRRGGAAAPGPPRARRPPPASASSSCAGCSGRRPTWTWCVARRAGWPASWLAGGAAGWTAGRPVLTRPLQRDGARHLPTARSPSAHPPAPTPTTHRPRSSRCGGTSRASGPRRSRRS
jgi:hypothetical protein